MNRISTRTSFSLMAVLMIVAGCTTSPATRTDMPDVSFDEVVAHADRQSALFRSLKGEGNLQIESPAFSQSVTFEVALLRPDSLQLIFHGPFGITVAQALVTRERFQLYNSLQNRLYAGKTSIENLEKTVRIGLTFDDILSMFTGGAILSEDRSSSHTTSAEGSNAIFLFQGRKNQRRYLVDPDTKNILKVQILNTGGAPIGEQSFSSFETLDGITYPRKVMITQHEDRRRLTIYYDSIEWNTITPSMFSFSVPANAERIELK